MTAEELLCLWAEDKYGFENVRKVDLKDEYDPDWSEYTPGEGFYVNVCIWGDRTWPDGKPRPLKVEHFPSSSKLIIEIAQFAATIDPELDAGF